MPKLSSRTYRYFSPLRGRIRTGRPKTFKTEESANAWAKLNGIESFDLVNLKTPLAKGKKLRVVPKESKK